MRARTRKILIISSIAVVCFLITVAILGEWYLHGLAPRARERVIAALSDRFDANVRLDSLDLTLFPTPRVEGRGLEIWRRNHPSKLPFLKISRFLATATLSDLFYQHDRVGEVNLEGLRIDIPPRRDELEPSPAHKEKQSSTDTLKVVIDTLIANGAVLQIEPKSSDKEPLTFTIQKLVMHTVGTGQPLTFVTVLENANPPGLINSSGSFGPWQRDDLRATPVSGSYTFRNANLGVFSGISGTLASDGKYGGQLEEITVDGSTDVPNFALKRGGAPVHLTTDFHAIVDGTNGDTLLQPVKAHFLQSNFVCRGGIEEKHPHAGKPCSSRLSPHERASKTSCCL